MPFLAPILPALIGVGGSLLAGKMQADAARPAAEAQAGVAQTQTDVINALLGQYQDVYAPYETELVGRQRGMMAGLPMEEVVGETLESLRGPFQLPEPLIMKALLGVQQQTEREQDIMGRRLGRSGIGGAAGEALMARIGEQGLRGKHGVMSQVMETEAEQTMANQLKAFDVVNQLMGTGLQTSMSGRGMLPGIQGGLQGLMQSYGQAASTAGAPWQQFAGAIPGAVGAYYNAQAQRPPQPTP